MAGSGRFPTDDDIIVFRRWVAVDVIHLVLTSQEKFVLVVFIKGTAFELFPKKQFLLRTASALRQPYRI
jgi:hypothetical protein